MNIIKYINQPFPKAEKKWKTITLISLFIVIFLVIFQPFGINLMDKAKAKILFLSGYGLVTFIVLCFDLILIENLFPKFFKEKNWVIWKEFIWLLWVIFSIGIGNAIYTAFAFNHSKPTLGLILSFQIITLVVALIPITVLIISKQKYLNAKHTSSADDLNKNINSNKHETNNKRIKIFADNLKDFIEIEISDFLFVESSGNYIEVHYLDQKQIKKTLRNTIKQTLTYFADIPEILQCHRAYIVNTAKINNAKGNSQGLRLSLDNCEIEVPVSRGYVNSIKTFLSE